MVEPSLGSPSGTTSGTGADGAPDGPDVRELVGRLAGLLAANDPSTQRAELARVAQTYRRLPDEPRAAFLRRVSEDLGVDDGAVQEAARRLLDAPAGDGAVQVELRRALTPRFTELLHLLTGITGGVKLVVDLRADLLALVRGELPVAEDEIERHLATLFDVGLLRLERVTWQSPARLLEKLIEYEAVHEMDGWDDLRDRLDTDRRCFAFLHPAMPHEPVVFVEIALVAGTPATLSELLDRDAPTHDPAHADTAVFYSITSCQRGLAGINLGNELLKTVVRELRRELPHLERFVTLSPIPTLRDAELGLPADVVDRLDRLPDVDPDEEALLRDALLPATARYLTSATGGRARDPVANFHLSNGALVDALRWRANTEAYELDRSWGVMASYRYEPDRIEANAAAYARGEVPASEEIEALARGGRMPA